MRIIGEVSASVEVKNLLNPAFCLILIRHAISSYETSLAEGMPFSKTFFVLPLVLPSNMRSLLPKRAGGYLVNWAIENPTVVVEIPELLIKTKSLTQDALLLGIQTGLLDFNENQCFTSSGRLRKAPDVSFKEFLGRAATLGKWLADFSEVEIFSQFNITP